MVEIKKYAVIGGGAWGTAIAAALVRAGCHSVLWARDNAVVEAINVRHENTVYLPQVQLAPQLVATHSLAEAALCDVWFLAVPTQFMRKTCADLALARKAVIAQGRQAGDYSPPAIVCAKGIEQQTLCLPGEIVREVLPEQPVYVLSGPTFAAEVARQLPTALTLAAADERSARELAARISSPSFRVYHSTDIVGAQVGGAIKNVMAVACGIAAGRGMGENTRAALITRGLAEMMRLAEALGGKQETLMGLTGLGDLALTCSSLQSRNMSLGLALGQGQTLRDVLSARKSVAEGVFTASAAAALAAKCGVEMPIVAAVDQILTHGADVAQTITDLLARPLKAERD